MLLYRALNVHESHAWNVNNHRISPYTCLVKLVYYNTFGNGRQSIGIPSTWHWHVYTLFSLLLCTLGCTNYLIMCSASAWIQLSWRISANLSNSEGDFSWSSASTAMASNLKVSGKYIIEGSKPDQHDVSLIPLAIQQLTWSNYLSC